MSWRWRDEVFGREASGFAIVGGHGHAAGQAYADFEQVVHSLVELSSAARVEPQGPDSEVVQWRFGSSGDERRLFVTNEEPATDVLLRVPANRSAKFETSSPTGSVERCGKHVRHRLPPDEGDGYAL